MGYIHAMDDDSARSTKKIMPVLPHCLKEIRYRNMNSIHTTAIRWNPKASQ